MNNDKILKESIQKHLNETKKDNIYDKMDNLSDKQIKYDTCKNE
jgi:hypothetical protein